MGALNLIFLFVVLVTTGFVWVSGQSPNADSFKFGITQWGDIRSHMQLMQKDDLPEPCKSSGGNCVGGIPQLLGYIKASEDKFSKDGINDHFRFVTGNLVSGENGFLSLLDWNTFGKLLGKEETKLYKPDYMSLGIKEFEAGLERTMNYLGAASTDVKTVISNARCPVNGDFGFCNKIKKSETVTLKGVQFGIVGFVNPLANDLADSDPIIFDEPAEAISEVVKNLPDSVIAIGTGNFEMAQSIIDKSKGKVKLVIYGGGTKDLTGNYPYKYKDSYIATTGSKFGTKLGSLVVTVEGQNIKNITGELTSLDAGNGVELDKDADAYLEGLRKATNYNDVVGETRVKIDGSKCWENECNLGNLVTDAMVHCAYNYEKSSDIKSTVGIISLWHGGAFLNDTVYPGDPIKVIDVHKWLPYHNNANFVKVKGSTLWKIFETSATGLSEKPNWGQFLQVSSGVEVKYSDNEISKILTVHTNEGIPQMEEIKDDAIYSLVIPSIMTKGKSVYKDLPELLLDISGKKFIHIGFDDDCVTNYLQAMGPVATGFEKRISLTDDDSSSGRKCNKKTGLTIFLTLLITAVIVGGGFAVWHFFIKNRVSNGNCSCFPCCK